MTYFSLFLRLGSGFLLDRDLSSLLGCAFFSESSDADLLLRRDSFFLGFSDRFESFDLNLCASGAFSFSWDGSWRSLGGSGNDCALGGGADCSSALPTI